MLHEKTEYLLNELNTDNTTIASYVNCSSSIFSKMRTGSRNYTPKSKTVQKFIAGIYAYAIEKKQIVTLCNIIGTLYVTETQLKEALLEWLFDESSMPLKEPSHKVDGKEFGQKLCSLMKLANVTSSKLSKELNVDPSYISRMRNGERIPQKKDTLMKNLCENLTGKIFKQDSEKSLAKMLDLPAGYTEKNEATELIYNWLYDYSVHIDVQAVKTLIRNIEIFPAQMNLQLPHIHTVAPKEILLDPAQIYEGDSGLQKAVIRFLGNAIEHKSTQLLLYSDRNMDWMEGDFRLKWITLMSECLKHKIKIKIIHNVDRSAAEMIFAINGWLPLYMSGLIEPYYCTKKQGERFSYTMFLDPGNACIESICPKELESEADYGYMTDSARLNKMARFYEALLSNCKPLVKFNTSLSYATGNYAIYTFSNIQLCISDNSVIVNKMTQPTATFTISHPMMCKAFKNFAESLIIN